MSSPTVIYLLGAGVSGSTLLAMALGGHPQITGLGEFTRFDKYRADDRACACGSPISKCAFWQEVEAGLDGLPMVPLMPPLRSSRLFVSGPELLRKDPHMPLIVERNVKVYRQIAKVAGTPVLVDATKSLMHFYYLYRSGEIRLVPVYVVRDGRAYLESNLRRRRRGRLFSIARWARVNLAVQHLIKKLSLREAVVHVRYTDFVESPEATLTRICERADLPFDPGMLSYFEKSHHNLGGNRMRLDPQPIAPNYSWQERLTTLDRAAFRFAGGHYWNRRFDV